MIGTRNIEPGQSSLTTGSPIQLVKIESVYIKIAVPENEINRMRKGMKATLTISALDGRAFEGEVSNVGVVADRFSRTYEAKILVKNTKLDIKPGMVCDVVVNTSSQHDAVVITYNAVSKDINGQPYVYLVSEDKKTVKKQHITLGNYVDSGVVVLGGLSLDQTIVCEGKEKLSDNSQISL
jgi:RND family efflux transporter, MFP subunit